MRKEKRVTRTDVHVIWVTNPTSYIHRLLDKHTDNLYDGVALGVDTFLYGVIDMEMTLAEWEKQDKYELFYADGGHSGPHMGLDAAVGSARRYIKGMRSRLFGGPVAWVAIVEYAHMLAFTPGKITHKNIHLSRVWLNSEDVK